MVVLDSVVDDVVDEDSSSAVCVAVSRNEKGKIPLRSSELSARCIRSFLGHESSTVQMVELSESSKWSL